MLLVDATKDFQGDEDCVAGAERYGDSVRSGGARGASGRDEVVRGCGGCWRAAARGGLLAYGVGGGDFSAAAGFGDWLGAVQDGDGGEVAGSAGEFFGEESADAGRRGTRCAHAGA